MSPKKDKGVPCFFIQTGVGNIVMRLRSLEAGGSVALTLHQIVAMDVPVKEIAYFDPFRFKEFYGNDGMGKTTSYNRITDHRKEEKGFLEYIV